MKHCILSILLLSSMLGYAAIFDSPAFRVSNGTMIELSNLRSTTISTDSTLLLDMNSQVSGIAISGRTTLEDREALVRVLLIDKDGKEYLVFEDMYLFLNEKEHEFSNVAIETAVLENVIPHEIKIFIRNAHIDISRIIGVLSDEKLSIAELAEQRKNTLAAQEEYLIDRWNKLNTQTAQYWIAGKTSISGLSYSDKKNLLGAIDDHYLSDGIEYYVGGFFLMKSHGNTKNNTQDILPDTRETNSYVESFDWRNRHGKNWMTSVKHQQIPFNDSTGNGGCWAFGSLAALESHVNLYYNQLLNLDLSEQELGSCSTGSLHNGGNSYQAYSYILANGITSEHCFPFLNDDAIPCDNKCANPEYIVNITGHSNCSSSTNQLKSELIQHGPIASGYCNGFTCHLMCLCGYGTITEGTHIQFAPQTSSPNIDTIIPANSDLIGKTYWIYKNSYGANNPMEGYLYVVYESDNTRMFTESLAYPVTLSTLTSDDIVCEDADNDGYYFWGLGPKPNNCPICCPDTPDGDDSNPLLAGMDNYGNFDDYVFPYQTTTISNDAIWNTDTTHCGNIIITNSATLTITSTLTMNPAAKIIVKNGGRLIVDAGVINNATIDILSSASMQLLHNGTLYLKQHGNLNVRLGAEANLKYGRVLLQ